MLPLVASRISFFYLYIMTNNEFVKIFIFEAEELKINGSEIEYVSHDDIGVVFRGLKTQKTAKLDYDFLKKIIEIVD